MNRAVFLDRDGVINRVILKDGVPHAPVSLNDFELLPGVGEAIESLKRAEFRIIVATNQPGVATGVQEQSVVESMNSLISKSFDIDDINVCYHIDEDACKCRKPKPGMLLESAAKLSIDLADSYMVGDRWRDVEAGKAAGCRTILLENGYSDIRSEKPDAVAGTLLDASKVILSGRLRREDVS